MLKIIKSLVVIVAVAAIATFSTYAYFTDSDSITGNKIASGTLALSTNPTSEVIFHENIYPGWVSVPADSFTTTNDGSLPLKYRVRAVLNTLPADANALTDALTVRIFVNGSIFPIYNGSLSGLLSPTWVVVNTNMPATGLGDTDTITVESYLATSAGNEVQDLAVNFSLQFDATQTNNPGWL